MGVCCDCIISALVEHTYTDLITNITNQPRRGHGVGLVGSSWTGNIHPTPAIELLQGKRGDHGCMAKAGFVCTCS